MREGFFDYGLSREEQRTLIEGYVKEGIRIRFAQQSGVRHLAFLDGFCMSAARTVAVAPAYWLS